MSVSLYGTCIDVSFTIWDMYRCQYHYMGQVLYENCIDVGITIRDKYYIFHKWNFEIWCTNVENVNYAMGYKIVKHTNIRGKSFEVEIRGF